jgi:hypothetical protein
MKNYVLVVLLLITVAISCGCSNTDKYIPTGTPAKGTIITPSKTTLVPTTKQYVTSMFSINRIWAGVMNTIFVEVVPKDKVKPNTYYRVQLYEKGEFRTQATVSWNQPEINVHTMRPVSFPATRQETDAYLGIKDLSDIFSVKIYEVPIEGE